MFRGHNYVYENGWWSRNGIAHQFSRAGILWRHAFPNHAKKATLAAFNYQAKIYGLDKAWINNGFILYKDLGEDFYARRLNLGWEGIRGKNAHQEIREFAELLLSLWPHQVRYCPGYSIKLSDLVVTDETCIVLCFDWKDAVVGKREVCQVIHGAFFKKSDVVDEDALFAAYKAYVFACLQKSWEDFLNKHGAEIDDVQAFREAHYNTPHFGQPDGEIIWEEFVTV